MFFTKKKQKQLEDEIQSLEEKVIELEKAVEEWAGELNELAANLEDEVKEKINEKADELLTEKITEVMNDRMENGKLSREELKASDSPYIEVVSQKFDASTNSIKLEFDWNNAFIDYLRLNGIKGHDEEEMVYIYMNAFIEDLKSDHFEGKNFK